MNKFIASLVIICLLIGASLAQDYKTQIVNLRKEVNRLKSKLAKTKLEKQKKDIKDKLELYQIRIRSIEKLLSSKPVSELQKAPSATPEARPAEVAAQPEVEEAALGGEGKKDAGVFKMYRFELGGVAGFFGGTTALFGEVRIPLLLTFAPVNTAVRISTGLAQNREGDRQYIPLNADVILSVPPGWLTGTQNYVGGGLNYVMRTSGGASGTIGAQLFYGVESEGFDGTVFGEMGYGALRTGFAGTSKGVTIMVGYRRGWSF